MQKYKIYLICEALNAGRISIVEATDLWSAKSMALSMYPGYTLVDC